MCTYAYTQLYFLKGILFNFNYIIQLTVCVDAAEQIDALATAAKNAGAALQVRTQLLLLMELQIFLIYSTYTYTYTHENVR